MLTAQFLNRRVKIIECPHLALFNVRFARAERLTQRPHFTKIAGELPAKLLLLVGPKGCQLIRD